MAHDIFLSYSRQDRLTAEAVCNRLESAGIRCWIAPRDVIPGADWTESILQAIGSCRVMVLIFSDHANDSRIVRIEVAHAFKHELTIIPFRIHDALPKGSLEFYLDAVHWLDALTPPLEQHLDALSLRVKALMPLREDNRTSHPSADKPAPADQTGRFGVSATVGRETKVQEGERLTNQKRETSAKSKKPPTRVIVSLSIVAALVLGGFYLAFRQFHPEGKLLATFEGHTDVVNSAVFSPDGRRVLTASRDNTARLWEAESGKFLATFQGHASDVQSAVFSPDGRRVLTASADKTARPWEAKSGRLWATFQGNASDVQIAAFGPDGGRVLTDSDDGTARLWGAPLFCPPNLLYRR